MSSSWRAKCQQDFGLVELYAPSRVKSKSVAELSHANDETTWKRYHEYRSQIEQEVFLEDNDNDGKARVLKAIQHALKQESISDVNYPQWLNHTVQDIENLQWESSDETVRSLTACATIFSPFLVSHAVKLQHSYHYRPRSDWCEFYCTWHFCLQTFNGEPNGDTRQQHLARTYPPYMILLHPLYDAEEKMEVLCSNGFMDPPKIFEQVDWIAIEDIFIENFTPHTVQRIRDWLYLSTDSSSMSDFDVLKLLFASVGTPHFETVFHTTKIGVGHVWYPNTQLQERFNLGADTSLNWLEYQARLVSGALRPCDKYYEPFDVQAKKVEWGRQVLQLCEPPTKYTIDEDEDLTQTPWLVWERALQSSTNMQMAMRAMTQLGYYRQ